MNIENLFVCLFSVEGGKLEKVCTNVVANAKVFFFVVAACFPEDNDSGIVLLI